MLSSGTTLIDRVAPRTGTPSRQILRDITLVVGGTLLLAMCARISFYLPWNPLVPITMQTFAVLLIGALFGPRLATATVVLYLLEGLAGLPVFSAGRNAFSPSTVPGLPLIVGPTAGYLFAMVPAAALVGWLARRGWDRQVSSAVPAMILGNLVILVGGFVWLASATWWLSGGLDLIKLFNAAVLPFLPGDALKLLLAALALPGGWALLRK